MTLYILLGTGTQCYCYDGYTDYDGYRFKKINNNLINITFYCYNVLLQYKRWAT